MTDDKTEKSPVLKENVIRIVTVFAYVSSVSMAALCLSSYYVFFWEPKPPGPGPPVIHPHAYVADPYPPLKLVAPLPDGEDAQGASFWQSVWSYFQPDETTTIPPVTYTSGKKIEPSIPEEYMNTYSRSTDTPEIYNETDTMETDNPSPQFMKIHGGNLNNQLGNGTNVFDNSMDDKPAVIMHQGYVGVISNRVRRRMNTGPGEKAKVTEPNKSSNDHDNGTLDNNTDVKDTKDHRGSTYDMGNTDNNRATKVLTNETEISSKPTISSVNPITEVTISTHTKTNVGKDMDHTKAIINPVDDEDKSDVTRTTVTQTTIKDLKFTEAENVVAKRNAAADQDNSEPKMMKLNEDAKTDVSRKFETKSTTLELSDRKSAHDLALAKSSSNSGTTTIYKEVSGTTHDSGVTKVTNDSTTKEPEDKTTMPSHTPFSTLKDENATEPSHTSVSKTSDSVTTVDQIVILSTDNDPQYQGHMRQLKPRRKFPGH